MGHGYGSNRLRGINKKKLAVAALVVGFVLLAIVVVIGLVVAAIFNASIGQADLSTGKSTGNFIQTIWTYVTDFISALWKQIIANPLQFLTGGNG